MCATRQVIILIPIILNFSGRGPTDLPAYAIGGGVPKLPEKSEWVPSDRTSELRQNTSLLWLLAEQTTKVIEKIFEVKNVLK